MQKVSREICIFDNRDFTESITYPVPKNAISVPKGQRPKSGPEGSGPIPA